MSLIATRLWHQKGRLIAYLLALLFFLLLCWPERLQIPVAGTGTQDWNPHSYWAYPWGKSVVHKGIDIFAKRGAAILAASSGVVLYQGHIEQGGQVILVLGPQWRLHYYAHLASSRVQAGQWVSRGSEIGTVGDSGNAKGKPLHLHYSIVTLLPHLWRWDGSRQGWKKIFYLNPDPLLQPVRADATAPRPD